MLASVVAVAAAIRSTWSPCGLSMLSTITPLGESGRRNRWAVTATWFIAGAVLGGATLGIGAAVLAAGVALVDLPAGDALGLAAPLAAVAIASDLGLGGFRLPAHTRQVNEAWLDQYRSWVYGGAFGWQIGVGLATYVTTAAVYLMLALAALTASPLAAFLIVAGFGLLRGLAVLLGARLTSPQHLVDLHRRLAELLPTAQSAVVLVEVAVLAVVVAVTWGLVSGAATGAVVAGVVRRARLVGQPG